MHYKLAKTNGTERIEPASRSTPKTLAQKSELKLFASVDSVRRLAFQERGQRERGGQFFASHLQFSSLFSPLVPDLADRSNLRVKGASLKAGIPTPEQMFEW